MKKIVIIEDDQIVANIYRNKFLLEGFKVEVALDGEQGLQLIREFHPDAVVLDLVLPKLSGVDLMRAVRAEPLFQSLPIVVFSNTYLSNMVQDAWKAGATKCLSKANCTPKQVIDAVRNSLLPKSGAPAKEGAAHQETGVMTTAPATPVRTATNDAEFQADLRSAFIQSLPELTVTLRSMLQRLIKADSEMARLKEVHELYRRIHALTGNAGLAGMFQIAQMADAIEALLKELYEKPRNINASTLRTTASAIDFLAVLFKKCVLADHKEIPNVNILVVDDEPISRRAIVYALDKAKLKSVNVEDPQMALNLLVENTFDLVFLDIDMPGMTGIDLCSKLRSMPHHKKTPVVFVTSLNDFENRTHSLMSGGNDFIAKPFLFIEMAVKALVYVLRGRMEAPVKLPAEPVAA